MLVNQPHGVEKKTGGLARGENLFARVGQFNDSATRFIHWSAYKYLRWLENSERYESEETRARTSVERESRLLASSYRGKRDGRRTVLTRVVYTTSKSKCMCTQCHHVKLLEALRSASPRFALPAREEGVLSPRCDTRLFRIQLYYQLAAAWQIDRKLRRICVRACVSPEERLLSLSPPAPRVRVCM